MASKSRMGGRLERSSSMSWQRGGDRAEEIRGDRTRRESGAVQGGDGRDYETSAQMAGARSGGDLEAGPSKASRSESTERNERERKKEP